MSTSKELQRINTTVLDQIKEVYLSDVREIEEYYPQELKERVQNLTDEVKKDIIRTGRRMTSGINSSIPMLCRADKCCLSATCALLRNKIQPDGFPCPYEELMVDKLTSEYYITLQIDPFNRVERDLIKAMVELIIIDNRASADIAKNGLYSVQNVGVDNKGRPIENIVESLAYNIKIKTQVRIDKIQNELLATRKVKKQLEVDKGNDPSSNASNLFDRFKNFMEAKKVDATVEIIK